MSTGCRGPTRKSQVKLVTREPPPFRIRFSQTHRQVRPSVVGSFMISLDLLPAVREMTLRVSKPAVPTSSRGCLKIRITSIERHFGTLRDLNLCKVDSVLLRRRRRWWGFVSRVHQIRAPPVSRSTRGIIERPAGVLEHGADVGQVGGQLAIVGSVYIASVGYIACILTRGIAHAIW